MIDDVQVSVAVDRVARAGRIEIAVEHHFTRWRTVEVERDRHRYISEPPHSLDRGHLLLGKIADDQSLTGIEGKVAMRDTGPDQLAV